MSYLTTIHPPTTHPPKFGKFIKAIFQYFNVSNVSMRYRFVNVELPLPLCYQYVNVTVTLLLPLCYRHVTKALTLPLRHKGVTATVALSLRY